MPRTFSLFSGQHHRPTSSSSDHYSKSDKSRKPLHHRTPNSLVLLSALCILVGAGGISFSLFVVLHPKEVRTFRCGRVEDTFRYFAGAGTLSDRPKLLGFVGIQTGFSSRDRRDALRSTWFPSDADGLLRLEQATGLAFRFVIGRAREINKMAELEKEIEKYNDFMLIDVEEEYLKLPYKTLAYFKAAFELFDADYYVKADDDIYLRPDRLATLLAKERAHPLTYIGCMKKGPVITDPKYKWYEKSGRLIGNGYFLHAYGPIYILSAEIVATIAIARNNSLRMFNNEDVTIGSWMLAMNVNHENNRAICDPRCTPTSIAVWDIPKCSGLCNPATRMKELHDISMCSKSPTLPPDDR